VPAVAVFVEIEYSLESSDVDRYDIVRHCVASGSLGGGESAHGAQSETMVPSVSTGEIAITARPPSGEYAAKTLADC